MRNKVKIGRGEQSSMDNIVKIGICTLLANKKINMKPVIAANIVLGVIFDRIELNGYRD